MKKCVNKLINNYDIIVWFMYLWFLMHNIKSGWNALKIFQVFFSPKN